LRPTLPIRPLYAESFRCIGSACEDTCCQGWAVPIDQAAYEKYQNLPPSPLRILIDESIVLTPPAADGENPTIFARIRMSEANECPMLTQDHLCGIQAELGEELLSHACATYPRVMHSIGGVTENPLTLSCPEAARLVLLSPVLLSPDLLGPDLPERVQESRGEIKSVNADEDNFALPPHFYAIRDSVLSLVRNRDYPLWQRLFLLGTFCRRLDSIANGELKRSIPDFLENFEAIVATRSTQPAIEAPPVDIAAQLDVVLRLSGMMLHRSNVRPRFVECVHAFTAGIGNGPAATMESLTAQYTLAHDRNFAPFFARHPHILENYIVNTIFRCQFPFGKEGMLPGAQPNMTREFALLTAQFALIKGFLIGVAGFHREAFSTAHVVHTVQAATKHFEHHSEFLNLAHSLLVERGMDGPRGLAILLRNAGPEAASPEIHAPTQLTGTRD
jgi:lysine-N-methylase